MEISYYRNNDHTWYIVNCHYYVASDIFLQMHICV